MDQCYTNPMCFVQRYIFLYNAFIFPILQVIRTLNQIHTICATLPFCDIDLGELNLPDYTCVVLIILYQNIIYVVSGFHTKFDPHMLG